MKAQGCHGNPSESVCGTSVIQGFVPAHYYLNPQEARHVQALRGRTVSPKVYVTLPSTGHSTEIHYWTDYSNRPQ